MCLIWKELERWVKSESLNISFPFKLLIYGQTFDHLEGDNHVQRESAIHTH